MEYPADSICGAFSMNFHIRHTTPSAMKGNFFVKLIHSETQFLLFSLTGFSLYCDSRDVFGRHGNMLDTLAAKRYAIPYLLIRNSILAA